MPAWITLNCISLNYCWCKLFVSVLNVMQCNQELFTSTFFFFFFKPAKTELFNWTRHLRSRYYTFSKHRYPFTLTFSLLTISNTVSTVASFCAPQWDHWCHCSHIQVHVTLTCGWWEGSVLWRVRCCQGCWKHHRWGHTVRHAAVNRFTLMIQTEKGWQPRSDTMGCNLFKIKVCEPDGFKETYNTREPTGG